MEASLSLSAAKDIKEPSLVMILLQSISMIVYEQQSQSNLQSSFDSIVKWLS